MILQLWHDWEREYYQDYLHSDHWKHLKIKHIYSNIHAECCICGATDYLVIHHERYASLYREVLNRDIVIVCHSCHERIHFVRVFFLRFKVKLSYKTLLRRRKWLRLKFVIQNYGGVASVWPFMEWLFA